MDGVVCPVQPQAGISVRSWSVGEMSASKKDRRSVKRKRTQWLRDAGSGLKNGGFVCVSRRKISGRNQGWRAICTKTYIFSSRSKIKDTVGIVR
jgi:hypothetical protein